MGRFALDAAAPAVHALVRGGRHHAGGLADDAQPRRDAGLAQVGNQHLGAEAADLFVVAERVVHGEGQVGFEKLFGLRHGQADEALHVGAAAAVQAAVAQAGAQRVERPVLTVQGTVSVWPDRITPFGLPSPRVANRLALRRSSSQVSRGWMPQRTEVIGDALDQRQVALVADAVEAHQALRPFKAAGGQQGVGGGVHDG